MALESPFVSAWVEQIRVRWTRNVFLVAMVVVCRFFML